MEALPVPKGPFGRLRITTGNNDKFSPVYINNKFMGHVDEFSNPEQGLLIPPGDYEVKIVISPTLTTRFKKSSKSLILRSTKQKVGTTKPRLSLLDG
jgi:hypothetical protein